MRTRDSNPYLILVPVLFASVLTLGLSGCELSDQNREDIQNLFSLDDSNRDQPPVDPVAPSCYLERTVQPDAKIVKKLDLLIVSDTSGSLDIERAAIADGIDAFVAELPVDLDFSIAVMPAHGSTSSYAGKIYGNPGVLNSPAIALPNIRAELKNRLTHLPGDNGSDGGEEGLYSFTQSVTQNLSYNKGRGFFRDDAALAVVFISDENDICAVYPAGVNPVYDPEKVEPKAKARDCGNITVTRAYELARELQGNRPLLFSAIVYTDPVNYPKSGENEYGYGYMDLIQLSNGLGVDLASGNYDRGLADIGRLVSRKLELITEFKLANAPIDPNSLSVKVDGYAVPFEFKSEINEVHLKEEDAGGARSVVDIGYCKKPDVQPSPSPSPSVTPTPSPSPSVTPPPIIIGT